MQELSQDTHTTQSDIKLYTRSQIAQMKNTVQSTKCLLKYN